MESASTSTCKESRLTNLICTAQPTLFNRAAKDVISHGFLQLVATDEVDSASTSVITAAAHSALVGNLVKFTSGNLSGYSVSVVAVDTDTITLGADLPEAPVATDAFQILQYMHPILDANGNLSTSLASGVGYTPGKLISAGTTNATVIKGSSGTVGYITASNINADERYLKLYNKATAPTVGTDVPVHTFIIPGNTNGAGTNIPLPSQGIALSTGIAIALTVSAADNASDAVAAGDIIVNYGYK